MARGRGSVSNPIDGFEFTVKMILYRCEAVEWGFFMKTAQEFSEVKNMPWLVFKLQEQAYAINSQDIVSIFQLDQPVVKVAEYDERIRGIINQRGSIVPLVELRKMLSMPSFLQEQDEFNLMLETRKQDHIHWVDELKRCLTCGEEFKLATNPHKCAFGKWYDHYHNPNHAVMFHLNKLAEPHRKLHESAVAAFSCDKHCDSCSREQCLQDILQGSADNYMRTVVGLLEEAKDVFKDSYREMCVILANDDMVLGLLVDEVSAVETLEFVDSTQTFSDLYQTSFVSNVAKSASNGGTVLVLDQAAIFAAV